MKKVAICSILLLVCFGYVFAEAIDETDYFSVEFEVVNHWGVHISLDPDEVFQGDFIEYRVRVENVYTAVTQRNVSVQLTFPNMWVDPPEIPQLYADFIGEGVAGDLPHGFSNTPTYATWTFDSIQYSAAKTIICTLQVRDDICGSYPNDVNLTAFAQAWSDFSEPTKTADLSDGVVVKCRPGLTCDAQIGKVGGASGAEISVAAGENMYITIEGCNYPYNPVDANDCLFYILLPPEAIALYDHTEPVCDGFQTIVGGSYDGWRMYWWNIDLAYETCETCLVFFQENNGIADTCFNSLGGVLWDADSSVLWTGDPLEPIENIVISPPSSYTCEQSVRWCLKIPDLVISVESPYDSGCISCGWPVSFEWTVTNEGTGIANADPLVIEFTSDGTLIGTETIPDFSLSTGNSISGTVPIANPACGVTIEFCAEVDANNVVEESDETNNSQCDELCIGITEINVEIMRVSFTDSNIDPCSTMYWADCDSPFAIISVTDQNGYPIRDLADICWDDPYSPWTDISVIESGTRLELWPTLNRPPLRMFTADEEILPLSVAIIMDYSGSMTWDPEDIPLAEAAVINYIESDLCAERFSIIKFGTDIEIKCDFTDDSLTLRSAVASTYTGEGGTNILGAVQVGLNLIEGDTDGYWHIIIVFSDGNDGSSMPMSEVADYANLLNTRVFTIGIGDDVDDSYLEDLASLTGGLYRHVDSPEQMEPLYLFFCNVASSPYIMQFTSGWTCETDTLTATVELQNDSTFGLLLSDSDTSEYETCCPECDLTINKHSSGLPLDTLFGVPYADAGAVIDYRISATNLGHATCLCDPVRIVDYLPAWAGAVDPLSISPACYSHDDNSIVWEIEPDNIVFGSNYILEFSFQVTDSADILNENESPYIINCVSIECGVDVDPTNNSDCDSVVVKLVPDPSIICEYLANSNHWPGDTAIINVACPLPTQPANWEVWFDKSCVVGSLPEPFENHAGQTLERMGFADSIVLPEVAEGCDIGEIWVYIRVRYDFMDSTMFYTDSCMLEVRRPPCRVRIDKNQINAGDEVMIEITQCDASDVRVQIIGISGDIVAEPLNENFGQGLFKFYWDGTDDMGHPVNTGVYGILVKAGDELYTFKLAVVR